MTPAKTLRKYINAVNCYAMVKLVDANSETEWQIVGMEIEESGGDKDEVLILKIDPVRND